MEHYAFCSCVRELAARRLRFDTTIHVNIHTFTCTNPRVHTKELLTRTALLIYATYRALNYERNASTPLRDEDLFHAMFQRVIKGVRGHATSGRVLNSTWTEQPSHDLPASV